MKTLVSLLLTVVSGADLKRFNDKDEIVVTISKGSGNSEIHFSLEQWLDFGGDKLFAFDYPWNAK